MLGRIGRFLRNVVRTGGAVKGKENTQAHQGAMSGSRGASGLAGLTKDEFVRPRGETALGDVTLTKDMDKNTPDLFEGICDGHPPGEVEIRFPGATTGSDGETGVGFSKYKQAQDRFSNRETTGGEPSGQTDETGDGSGTPGATEGDDS